VDTDQHSRSSHRSAHYVSQETGNGRSKGHMQAIVETEAFAQLAVERLPQQGPPLVVYFLDAGLTLLRIALEMFSKLCACDMVVHWRDKHSGGVTVSRVSHAARDTRTVHLACCRRCLGKSRPIWHSGARASASRPWSGIRRKRWWSAAPSERCAAAHADAPASDGATRVPPAGDASAAHALPAVHGSRNDGKCVPEYGWPGSHHAGPRTWSSALCSCPVWVG
jgi:hypothetical protein